MPEPVRRRRAARLARPRDQAEHLRLLAFETGEERASVFDNGDDEIGGAFRPGQRDAHSCRIGADAIDDDLGGLALEADDTRADRHLEARQILVIFAARPAELAGLFRHVAARGRRRGSCRSRRSRRRGCWHCRERGRTARQREERCSGRRLAAARVVQPPLPQRRKPPLEERSCARPRAFQHLPSRRRFSLIFR